MTRDEAKRFLDELDDCEGDMALWEARKERENSSFYGFEINPEKEKKLNSMRELCKKLARLDDGIKLQDRPLTNENRHGAVAVSLPVLFFTTDRRVSGIMARLFDMADSVSLAAPRLLNEDFDDEDFVGERNGREILITFTVSDMWKTYGKRPF